MEKEQNDCKINEEVKENVESQAQTEENSVDVEDVVEETLEESEVNEDLEFEEMEEDDMFKKYSKLKAENGEKVEEIKLLNNKLNAVQDKHIRITAEYDNFRKRTVKEKEQLYTDACASVLKEMLPVVDNLERALAMDSQDGPLREGMEMTLKQFYNSLEKLGVKEIPAEGKFDPNFHEAVMHMMDENYGESEIVEVFQKGFMRGDKVLRYTMVKVAN